MPIPTNKYIYIVVQYNAEYDCIQEGHNFPIKSNLSMLCLKDYRTVAGSYRLIE